MKKTMIVLTMMLMSLTVDAQVNRYDLNNDGKVTVTDAMIIVDAILQGNDDATENDVENQRKVTFVFSENPLVTTSGSQKAGMRRAPELTTNSLTGKTFYINMMYDDGFEGTDRSFTYEITLSGHYEHNGYWPIVSGNDIVTVFGYYTYYKDNEDPFDLNDGKPYLNVTVDENSSDQIDVLVAKNTDTWNGCQGVVNLNFNHICSALKFSVMKTQSLANYTVEVNQIKLWHINKSGKYDLLEDTWNDVNNVADFTLKAYKDGTQQAVTVTESAQPLGNGDNDYLFLIPQVIEGMTQGSNIKQVDDSKSYLEIQCKIHDGAGNYLVGDGQGYGSVYLPFSASLQQGHIHPYVISIGTAVRHANGEKVFN